MPKKQFGRYLSAAKKAYPATHPAGQAQIAAGAYQKLNPGNNPGNNPGENPGKTLYMLLTDARVALKQKKYERVELLIWKAIIKIRRGGGS